MASLSYRPQAGLSLLRLAALAILSVALAGCIPRTRPAPLPPPDTGPAPDERPSRLPPDETRNRVAVLVPLAGPNGALGRSLLNAANLALFDTGGEQIRITAYDTSAGAAAAANEALADGSGLILGPLLADDVRVVAPIARREQVPVVAFSNDVAVAGDGVYVMGLAPGQSISRVVAFAHSRGVNRFGGLLPNDVYGERAGEALIRTVEGARAQIGRVERFERSQASIRAAASAIADGPRHDAVLVAAGSQTALVAVPIIRQTSPQPRVIGTELWASERDIGSHAGLRGAWFAATSDANFGPFRTRYRARYGSDPFRLAALGYDAVLLTVRIAADWPPGRRFPERALRDPTGFAGVDGAFRFGSDGVVERALEVREVGASGTIVVSPAPRGFN